MKAMTTGRLLDALARLPDDLKILRESAKSGHGYRGILATRSEGVMLLCRDSKADAWLTVGELREQLQVAIAHGISREAPVTKYAPGSVLDYWVKRVFSDCLVSGGHRYDYAVIKTETDPPSAVYGGV